MNLKNVIIKISTQLLYIENKIILNNMVLLTRYEKNDPRQD